MKQLMECMGELGINLSHLKTKNGEERGRAMNRWEEDRSRGEVESKITLQLYSNKMSIWDILRYIAIVFEKSSFSNVERIL